MFNSNRHKEMRNNLNTNSIFFQFVFICDLKDNLIPKGWKKNQKSSSIQSLIVDIKSMTDILLRLGI